MDDLLPLLQALEESQVDRGRLTKELADARAEIEILQSWWPLDIESSRVTVCMTGEEGERWAALFQDAKEAKEWSDWIQKKDPERYRIIIPMEGEMAGLRFWNDVQPIPPVKGTE